MTFIIADRVRESTSTTGTGSFALNGGVSGYRAFSAVMANGDTTWYSCVLPGGAWEVGVGTWITGNTLQRTTILGSSTGAIINFGAGTKDVFMALPASKGNALNNSFPSGTLMLFQQTAAPIYWTKQVTHNDKALRVVSGTASSGGSNAFSTVFSSTSTNSTTITQSTMASHQHSYGSPFQSQQFPGSGGPAAWLATTQTTVTGSSGGDGAHAHSINLSVQYVDLIIASKD